MKLGKRAPRLDRRTLKFSNYRLAKAEAPYVPPTSADWLGDIPTWGMCLNDSLGDCVCAAMAHIVQQLTFYAAEKLGSGEMIVPTDEDVLKSYQDISGYVVDDPSTDNGCDMLTALNYWRQTGIGGHKILAFVSVDPTNAVKWQEAVALFGNIFTGLALPTTAQSQGIWAVPDGGAVGDGSPGSWGGHCVPDMRYDADNLACVTWGAPLQMTQGFFNTYCDECYAVLDPEWVNAAGMAPSGFNLDQLKADLASL
jgi:hypothetical protein